MPHPCRSPAMPCVNSHMPCRAPSLFQQCRVLRASPRGSRKYPNCYSNSLIVLFVVCCYHSLQSQVWIVVRRIGMLLITIFVELRVVAGRNRTRAGSPQAVSRRPCCAVALRRTAWSAWHGRGMASVNQTRPHCVNQMGKTHSKPLAARHGKGTAWVRHGHGMLCVNRPYGCN